VTEGDGFKAKADELLASMTEKRVPKDLDMPLRQLKPYIRKTYGLTFKNVAMTEELWLRYRAQPVSWVPEMLPEEDGNV
jgi:hypothetical protein